MKNRIALAVAILALAGCDAFPRDTEGTAERVRGASMRVGLVGGSGTEDAVRGFVATLERDAGTTASIETGAAEPMLARLESGELDLVIGAFAKDTPWMKHVTFSRPITDASAGSRTIEVKAATRNGEHRWAMAVDRAVKRASAGAL